MATQELGPIFFPSPPFGVSGQASYLNHLLDAGDEKHGSIFRIPKTGTVSKIHWRTGTVTTGATVDVRLETIDASGDPSGTLHAANTNGAQVVADANDNATFTTALTAGASVTKGQERAVVIVNPTVSPGNFNVSVFADNTNHFPYTDLFTTVWAKSSSSPVIALEYDDGSYVPIICCFPCALLPETLFNTTTTPDEIGIIFSLTVPVRASGVWLWTDLDSPGDVKLYDSDGSTVLASTSLDPAKDQAITSDLMFFHFSSTISLLKNTNYRLTLLPTTTTSLRIQEFTVAAVAIMDAFPGGQAIHRTHRTDAGAWTETTTQRPFMGLIIDGLDDGVGAGGGAAMVIGE